MSERAYTVSEIDALREALQRRWLFGNSIPGKSRNCSRSYHEEEKTKCVEELVRTHMLAGHLAQDIYAADA